MEMRKLGRTEIDVSSCCLGTMTWGQQNSEAEGHEQMDYAVERGVNFFDTAELYAIPPDPKTQGSTESVIGTWFASRKNREDIVLATKVVGRTEMTWHRRDFGPVELCRLTKEQIDFAVEQSLTRLQTDYIDLYQLHWPDRPVPMFGGRISVDAYEIEYETFQNTLEALEAHVKAGRIRHIGLSNETPYGVMRFLAESDTHGLTRMASIQNAYNLTNRTFEEGLGEIALREQVGLLAYSPLAQGYLTGKYRNGALPKGSRKELFNRLERYESDEAQTAIEAYLTLADDAQVDPTHLAIRFCDTRPFTTSTIIGATTTDQLKSCIDAFELDWTDKFELAVNEIHTVSPNPAP